MRVASLLFAIITIFFVFPCQAKADDFDYSTFARVPVLHEGRIKPLDTFARSFLLTIHGRTHVEGLSATEWLAEMLFDQEMAYQRHVFNIPNPDVLLAIDLPSREGHRYSFNEVNKALKARVSMMAALDQVGRENLSQAQNQLLDLYVKSMWYIDISRSFSLLLPDFSIKNKALAERLDLPFDTPLTYLDLMGRNAVFSDIAKDMESKKAETLDPYSLEILRLGTYLRVTAQDQKTELFRIIPPQWETDGDAWFSPWAVLEEGRGSPNTASLFALFTSMAMAYDQKDAKMWDEKMAEAFSLLSDMAGERVSKKILTAEYKYNALDPFYFSLVAYLFVFLLLLCAQFFAREFLRRSAFLVLLSGAFIHAAGIFARMYIMNRPPVATLYESVLFVGLVAVLFSLFLEWRGKNGVGLLIGAICGSVLQFIGMRYSMEGDSMGMLLAVLDTNFWLATHVLTITIGYGCCFVAALLAHLYVLARIYTPQNESRLSSLLRSITGTALVALFFSVLGTILGGIWADQSWGRFWGWDPKENGAMLICLWLIWLSHGRIAGMLSPLSFAFGMAMTNVVVVLAWFGVNLLNVGLHSYGFTENIATNIALFSGAEMLFVVLSGTVLLGRHTKKREAKQGIL